MHKTASLVVCLVAVVAAIPTEFKRGFEGSPLVIEYDVGTHQHIQTGDAGNAVRGSYSYLSTDGSEHTVNYIADENGYRVVGGATFASGNRPVAPSPLTLVPVISEPIAVAEPVDIADPVVTIEPIELGEPSSVADPVSVAEPVTIASTEPSVTELVVAESEPIVQPLVEPTEPAAMVSPSVQKPGPLPTTQTDTSSGGYKLVPISYGSYPYRYNQFQGYYPTTYGFSDGLPYYQGGYSLPYPYGYGFNAGQIGQIGGYVLKPVKVNGNETDVAKRQQQLQEQYRKQQLDIQKQFQLYQGQFEQQSYPYGKFVIKIPKQRQVVESTA